MLVSVEASTDDSVVGHVIRNYAHPSECPPTSYYRRNTRPRQQSAHLSSCTIKKLMEDENHARFIMVLS